MRLEFLEEGPGILVEHTSRVLAVADLHLGIESDLARSGLHFRSRSCERLERIQDCIGKGKPDMLVLLGDVKHSVPFTSRQEYREIPGILDELRSMLPIRLAPGNHDPGIERYFSESELLRKEGELIDGVGYLHGHTYPHPSLQGRLVLSGHHHPFVSIRDEVGCALRAPAYLLSPADDACLQWDSHTGDEQTRVLFVPALNELAGYDILRTVREPFSPLSRCIKTGESQVFLTDGTFIGPLSILEDHGDDQGP